MSTLLNAGADLAEDARRLLLDLDRVVPGAAASNGECRPPLDVLETAGAVEVVVDVPGVAPEALRVVLRRDTILVVGAKLNAATGAGTRFHVAERSYGRFARAVRLAIPVDASHARATVSGGQLRITLPRIDDRRGPVIEIPIDRA